MPPPTVPTSHRRTTAAALRQRVLAFLADSLPEDWVSQPLEPARTGGRWAVTAPASRAGGDANAVPDILIISPRGRCHFLFVRAPADRWWDGGLHSVPAEAFGAADAAMARRLRAAGHKARVLWCERDLRRALQTWGCPVSPPRRAEQKRAASGPGHPPGTRTRRPTLHLGFGRSRAHG